MTAEEESRETKQEQDEGRHERRFLDYMAMKVEPLPLTALRPPTERTQASPRVKNRHAWRAPSNNPPDAFNVRPAGRPGLSCAWRINRIGIFGRWGWNNGQTESFIFTAIDRVYEAGISATGIRWCRPHDVVATAFAAAGLSAIHAEYLARSGLNFLIGDGALRYGQES